MILALIIIFAVASVLLVSAVDCARHIEITDYEVPVKGINNTVKIACISDLHGWEYGKNNSKLTALVAGQKPDIIVIAGDMITRRASERQICKTAVLIEKLAEISDVYYATGNHEADYMAKNGTDILERISDAGAAVLYDSWENARAGSSLIRIGGAAGRYFDGSERDVATQKMLEDIGCGGMPAVAVVHQPENIIQNENRRSWSAELYLCGHTHGGVWRVPGLGGIVAPSQGLFPKYDKGSFTVDGKIRLIINAGLSGYYFIPRVFNRPEICMITLTEQKDC